MSPRVDDEQGFGLTTVMFTLMAVVLAFVALAVAAAALDSSNEAKDQAKAAGGTAVGLSEFRINPADLTVAEGGVLKVSNTGTTVHNLAVKGQDLTTPDLKSGDTATLDLGKLDAGMYEVYCTIPGHADAGMKGALMVGTMAGHGGTGTASEDALLATNESDDKTMKQPVDAYVAQLDKGANTAGVGGQLMVPKVLPDGTKEFDVTASIVDWEVEPGKTVRAWAYNGTVPGPTIKVNPGDKVRVVLDNQLPQSTAIHFHGIDVPNAMDGVPDVTQEPVKPGEKFTYEFVAKGPAVGMYHSHHHAEHQVPDGLAGAFLIGDEPIPAGVTVSQEVPMVLNDAGVIGLTLNGKSFPATAPVIAKQGEWVEVHYMNEGLQVHPMHLHGLPQLVIAKDGFPVPQPYQMDTVLVAPGERYTVLVQATEPGVWAWHCHILTHAERADGMFGMVTTFIVK
ncbi:MAG: multicopper oxidase domain-containing protein [Acidimicrobiia bacterium]|jgi:FtsP/CotA-like multicopper oxidase with cupredoxin domain